MGLLSMECMAFDGTNIYGLATARRYNADWTYNSDTTTYYVLVKSNANPTSYATATWSFLSAVPQKNTITLYFNEYASNCYVDTKGVFWVISYESAYGGSSSLTSQTGGMMWDPLGTQSAVLNGTGAGGWTVAGSSITVGWQGGYPSQLFTIGTSTIQAYVASGGLVNFSIYDSILKQFVWQSSPWNLNTILTSLSYTYYYDLIGFDNNTLYMAGSTTTNIYLVMFPLSAATLPAPSASAVTIANLTVPATSICLVDTFNSVMKVINGNAYILCSDSSARSMIYQYNSTGWAAPVQIGARSWNSGPDVVQFVPSSPSQSWIYIEDYNADYSVNLNNGIGAWSKVGGINITETYGTNTAPSPTYTYRPNSGSSSSSIGGSSASAGTIAGVVVGIFAFLISFCYSCFYKWGRHRGGLWAMMQASSGGVTRDSVMTATATTTTAAAAVPNYTYSHPEQAHLQGSQAYYADGRPVPPAKPQIIHGNSAADLRPKSVVYNSQYPITAVPDFNAAATTPQQYPQQQQPYPVPGGQPPFTTFPQQLPGTPIPSSVYSSPYSTQTSAYPQPTVAPSPVPGIGGYPQMSQRQSSQLNIGTYVAPFTTSAPDTSSGRNSFHNDQQNALTGMSGSQGRLSQSNLTELGFSKHPKPNIVQSFGGDETTTPENSAGSHGVAATPSSTTSQSVVGSPQTGNGIGGYHEASSSTVTSGGSGSGSPPPLPNHSKPASPTIGNQYHSVNPQFRPEDHS